MFISEDANFSLSFLPCPPFFCFCPPHLSLSVSSLQRKANFFVFKTRPFDEDVYKVECSCQLTTAVHFKNCWVLCVAWEFQCPLPLPDWCVQMNTSYVACALPRAEAQGRIIMFCLCFLRYTLSIWLELLLLQGLVPPALEWRWHPFLISLCGIKIHEDQYRIVTGNFTS